MRKKPRGQHNAKRGEKKKTTWHKLLEQKCTKKLKIVATEKKCGEFQREKRTMVSKHTRSTKSLDFSEKKDEKLPEQRQA